MNSTNPNPKKSRKGIYATIIVAVVIIGAIWIWKEMQLRSVKKVSAKDAIEMENQFTKQMLEIQSQDLRSIIKVLVWAVRSEMVKNNLTDINFYINELVKDKGFQFILITNDKNIIISSTNKKWEGSPLEVTGILLNISSDSTIINLSNNNVFLASAPIMGFNSRLGTLLIKYTIQPLSFQMKK